MLRFKNDHNFETHRTINADFSWSEHPEILLVNGIHFLTTDGSYKIRGFLFKIPGSSTKSESTPCDFWSEPGWWISRAHEFSPYVYLLNICTKYTYILPCSNDPLFCCVISICVNRIDPGLIPRHPKSSKCLVSRCLERWKALKAEMSWGFKHLFNRYLDVSGMIHLSSFHSFFNSLALPTSLTSIHTFKLWPRAPGWLGYGL